MRSSNRPRHGRRWWVGITAAVLSGAVIAAALPGGHELRVTAVRPGARPLLVLPLEPGEPFVLHYYHSVENAPIWETHRVDDSGAIFVEEERYLKLGAGMGHLPGEGRLVQRGPYEAIEAMHRPTGDFILRVGTAGVDHTVLWRDRTFDLTAVAAHQAVRFSARPVSKLRRAWLQLFWRGEAISRKE